ncbi:AAA family ATPase [Niabella sp. CC-SYL272]|uniref:AAA family ATPase n=1 Tax=Niabella agricola TaxID=2891571 RepID=UPI001F21484E|nr:AAA family ATPase [Niabella agricola]MCF3108566.1 AAA family ATPase [Niabella agricola]
MIVDRFHILTGGPGSGKTTLLTVLEGPYFHIVPEVAREIIREQMAAGGTALPWKDQDLYTSLMLERSLESYQATLKQLQSNPNQHFFFDRGIPDTLCYATLTGQGISEDMNKAASIHRYNPTVFMLPPWKEIYTTDTERKQSWEEAVVTYEQLKATYTNYQYKVVEVPTGPPQQRSNFIIASLGL